MKKFFEESKTVSAEVVVKQIPEKEVVVDTKPVDEDSDSSIEIIQFDDSVTFTKEVVPPPQLPLIHTPSCQVTTPPV